jgi:hypothetical protein
MKKIYFVLPLLMALSGTSTVFAQDKYTISGEVVYSGDSSIYVCLLNSKTFAPAVGRQKELPPPDSTRLLKPTPSGKASFAFKDVPKGDYLVHAFADENIATPIEEGGETLRSVFLFKSKCKLEFVNTRPCYQPKNQHNDTDCGPQGVWG